MPPARTLTPGYEITYPNREKVASHITRVAVALILLASVALILAVTIGGWSKLQGLKPVDIVWAVSYLLIAIWVMRWSRGLLPIAAALGILMLLVSVIAATGAAGTSWFQRNHSGYAAAQSMFGGKGFSADTLGVLTTLVAPVQLLLIIACSIGFSQGWNVEVEAPIDRSKRRGRGAGRGDDASAAPSPAAS
jgi:hypothetical protein